MSKLNKLKEVKILEIKNNKSPKFIKTKAIKFSREGAEGLWEAVEAHDSVHVLVNDTENNELILVEQVRIPVKVHDNDNSGVCLEAVAGIVDKDIPLEEIAKEEILEEIGYNVPTKNIKHVCSYKSSVGTQGSDCHTFYTEVDNSMKVNEGGGLENEDIRVVRLKYNDINSIIKNGGNTDSTTLFLLTYFLYNLS